MIQSQYDLIVIGAGPGGYVAAIKAAQAGMKTAVIERADTGGTCLNRGCIPTKTLLHSSHLYGEMLHSELLGVSVASAAYDIERIYARKDEVVKQLRDGVEYLLKANGIDLLRASATIACPGRVIAGGEEHSCKYILIATGSVPARPPIPGLDLPGVITSDELLAQPLDKDLVIIGGGVIGVEFATVFNSLGRSITIIEALDRILPTMDKEISQNLNMIMKKRGIAIQTASMVKSIEAVEGGLICRYEKKGAQHSAPGAAVLVCIGRRANTEGLFAEGFALKGERGIAVDEHFQTSSPGIYAIGDVVEGGIQLAHVASAQGAVAVAHMAGQPPEIDLNTVPSCIYTDPEIAAVGLSEAQAKELGRDVKTSKYSMAGNGKSIIEMQGRGFIKLVYDAQTEALLGAQLMCARATDMIAELATAISNRLTIKQLAGVIRPHPTFCEGVSEAAEDAHGVAVHVVPKRK